MNFPIIENTYQFECTQCGHCCSGDQKINLNPFDLYKMARYKGLNHSKYLFDNNIVHLVKSQNNAWIPRIKFISITKKKLKTCPFLINELDEENRLRGLCSLHPDFKPLVCALSPAGRVLDFTEGTEHFIYVKPAVDCPGVDIKSENILSEQLKAKKDELDYELGFLKILDSIIRKDMPEVFYLENLYYFETVLPFKKIFQNLEKSLKLLLKNV
jgi:Fe-S-cluster containining protein